MNPILDTMNGVAALGDVGVLRVAGPDALAFLNAQLTQQMAAWEPGQARLAGYCSPKGRLLASFVAWRAADDEVLLVCSADLLAVAAKRLSMFVLRAKCRVLDASSEFDLFGLAGTAATTWLGARAPREPWQVRRENDWIVALPPARGVARYLLVATKPAAPMALGPLELQTWHALEASAGVPRIVAATAEQFVPQMINFELVGGVDFRKGCYPGQEVVARSQYRGAVKRRMFLFDSDDDARPGQEIAWSGDASQPAGMVVNAGRPPGHPTRLLAEVKLAALDSGTLHVGALTAPALRRVELPYPIPEPAVM